MGRIRRRRAYLRESKGRNGKSWPEWMGEESPFHPDNRAREDARWELEQDITIPDYTRLVEATVGQRMSIAAETIMAHLSTCIVLSHARLKAEQRSMGGSSLPKEIRKAGDYVNRVRDQIEMLQYVRGRIGEDRSTLAFTIPNSDRILDSGWIQGVCADILSHTWPVRGGDQPRTTPMPIQRISTDFWGSPDHPRRAETAERATWGTKTPPRPPTAGTPPAPARVRRKPRRWDPLVPIWGGSPVAAPRPPAPQTQSIQMGRTPAPPLPQREEAVGNPRPICLPLPTELRKIKNKR